MVPTIPKWLRYFGVVLLVAVAVSFLQLKTWLTRPLGVVGSAISTLTSPVRSAAVWSRQAVASIASLRSLYVENAELKQRVGNLEQQLASLQGVDSENAVLKATLGFANRPPVRIVPCTVISRDPEGLTQTLLLSCGVGQGLAVGQGVVSQGYLIGKVILTSGSNATVRLITAPATAIDVRVASRQTSGVLRGSFGSGLELDFVSDTSGVLVGDLVTTAGVNARIPPDVLVGSVAHVEKKPGALFSEITVKSPVDLRDIRFVHVLEP